MKTTLKTTLIVGLIAVGCLTASVARAGYHALYSVSVSQGSRYGSGSLPGARYSSDGNQYIGCISVLGSGSPYASCYATDASGNSASCMSTDPKYIAAAGTVTPASWIYFTFDQNGNCTLLEVNNASYFIN
jgi:hypothetical protein